MKTFLRRERFNAKTLQHQTEDKNFLSHLHKSLFLPWLLQLYLGENNQQKPALHIGIPPIDSGNNLVMDIRPHLRRVLEEPENTCWYSPGKASVAHFEIINLQNLGFCKICQNQEYTYLLQEENFLQFLHDHYPHVNHHNTSHHFHHPPYLPKPKHYSLPGFDCPISCLHWILNPSPLIFHPHVKTENLCEVEGLL